MRSGLPGWMLAAWVVTTAAFGASAAAAPPTPGEAAKPEVAAGGGAVDLATARAALASVPALAGLAAGFAPFSDSDVDAALRRGGRSRQSIAVWTIMPALFQWTPMAGRKLLVLSGRSGAQALLAVFEILPDGHFAHRASALIDEPDATLAIGTSEQYPKQLTWSSCYGCAGEGGTVRFDDDGRVEFSYR